MKALRFVISTFCLVFLCSAMSFASAPEFMGTNDISATRASGPAPVPICPPEDGWCETLPPKAHIVSGPAPVPICPPEDGWCETLPPKAHIVSGPAPVPICPPEDGWCETLPPRAHATESIK
jgi:hypothetical protein